MLSSQITPETNEEGGRERLSAHTTPRTSVSFPTGNAAARPTEQNPGKRNNPTAYTTPHDAILADLLGTTRGGDLPKEERGVSSGAESSSHLEEARTGTNQQERATPQPTSPEVLFDPFDGSPLGVLVPHQDDPHADDQSVLQGNPFLEGMHSDSDNAMWTRLSKVLDIQSQISKMHLEMEGIGNAKTADSKRKMYRMSTKPASDATGDEGDVPEATEKDPALPPGLHQPRARVSSTVSTISTAGDAEGDEEGVNVPSEEAEKNRIREEEFEKLTTQFEGRKEAISGIMSKLDELCDAVRRFQYAPNPTMPIFPIRQNTVDPYLSKSMSAGESEANKASTTQMNAPEWNEDNATSSSPVRPVPPLDRAKSDTVIIGAPSKRSAPDKRPIPALMLNSMDLDAQTHLIDSPASTAGSLHEP